MININQKEFYDLWVSKTVPNIIDIKQEKSIIQIEIENIDKLIEILNKLKNK